MRLAAAGRPEHDDVALLQFHVVPFDGGGIDALVVVVDGDGERALGRLLADDVLVELAQDFLRFGDVAKVDRFGLGVLLDDFTAELNALVADVHAGPAMMRWTSSCALPQNEQRTVDVSSFFAILYL